MWELTIDPYAVQEKHGFRLGDRVVFTQEIDRDFGVVFDCRGTVCDLENDKVGVRWDTMRPGRFGHTCGGLCDDNHGWYVDAEAIMLEITDEPIELNSSDLNALMEML